MSEKKPDDLEAVRTIVSALEPFDPADRDRVLRWVCEKLEMTLFAQRPLQPPTPLPRANEPGAAASQHRHHGATDIRSFIESKSPRSDVHFAAAMAYYFAFEAPVDQRKEEVGSDDLLAACRLVNRKRPPVPTQTMLNAHNLGYLDKSPTKGLYRINSVGENLVAMVLPNGGGSDGASKRTARKRTSSKRRKEAGAGKSKKR